MLRPEPFELSGESYQTPKHLILVRVLEPTSTPLSSDVSRTYFEMHKSHMPAIDVFTKSELQWGAMKASVLGTYYDDDGAVSFGADIETYYSPHLYEVYCPPPAMLGALVNAFVAMDESLSIGTIRLTESAFSSQTRIDVRVAPRDFVGARTALFGKTRMGKSNTVKIIMRMIMDSDSNIGQVVFDLNGEYANRNEQDDTSIFELYQDRCVRYSLRQDADPDVRVLKANFFTDLELGLRIIRALWEGEWGKPAGYETAFMSWELPDEDALKRLKTDDRSQYTRTARNISIYRALLHRAGFEAPESLKTIDLNLKEAVRALAASGDEAVPDRVTLSEAGAIYAKVWRQYNPAAPPFNSGHDEYFDPVAQSLLSILAQAPAGSAPSYTGYMKLRRFLPYHSVAAANLVDEIVKAVDGSKTVIVDLSNAADEIYGFYCELLSRAVFDSQMRKFTSGELGDHYVQFYFEEAHNLFPRDDSNLKGIYNRLAKEGAKFHIGLVYSTQSIASLSPDLLKNTENFFIAHLNDESEIRSLTRYYEFRDVGADVQRTKTKGFVRMITSSHRFALPVQIDKFGPDMGQHDAVR